MLVQEQLSKEGKKSLSQKIAIFYGSIMGERRQEIIQKLKSGDLKVLLSTSALEAGIDLPELDCCLIRGYPGSLMSFRQRIGRVGRKNPGLIIYLPIAINTLDYYYGKNPEQLLQGDVESAASNPDYPTILAKHLECAAAESGLAVADLTTRFGSRAGTVANILINQQKMALTNRGLIYARGYPHKDVNMRTNQMGTMLITDKETNDTLEEMSQEISYREVYPNAIYATQSGTGEIAYYRSEDLDLELHKATLMRYAEDPGMLTKAIMNTYINVLSTLMDPVSVPTSIAKGALELQMVWGEINSAVNGYGLYAKPNGKICTNSACLGFKKQYKGTSCRYCGQSRSSDEEKLIEKIWFERPYQTIHQAPIVTMTVNEPLAKALEMKALEIKQQLTAQYGENIPQELKGLTQSSAIAIALHSLAHQINAALPLIVLSSSRDINDLCIKQDADSDFVGFFFDTCDGGNGGCEAIFENFISVVQKALSLSQTCDCLWGCPRCLFRSGCPHNNDLLHKQMGLFLIKQIHFGNQ